MQWLKGERLLREHGTAYKTLGQFDILVFSTPDGEPKNWVRTLDDLLVPDGVVHSHNVAAFRILDAPESDENTAKEWFRQLPRICGIVFIKPAPQYQEAGHVKWFEDLVRWLRVDSVREWIEERHTSDGEVQLDILARFGWNDLVLVVGAAKFTTVLRYVAWLRSRSRWVISKDKQDTGQPLIETTTTVPAFDYEDWATQRLRELDDRLHAKILVEMTTINVGRFSELVEAAWSRVSDQNPEGPKQELESSNPEIRVLSGHFDVELSFGREPVPLGVLLTFLTELRDGAFKERVSILHTQTQLSLPSDPDVAFSTAWAGDATLEILNPLPSLSPRALSTLTEAWADFGGAPYQPSPLAAFRYMLATAAIALQDPRESARYQDMVPFLTAVLEQVEQRVDPDSAAFLPPDRIEAWAFVAGQIEFATQSFWRGFAQRSGGGRGDSARSSYVHTAEGGRYNSLLRAAETVASTQST